MSTVAPPHSFINVTDFAPVEALVGYFKRFGNLLWWKQYVLQGGDARFASYFRWRTLALVHN